MTPSHVEELGLLAPPEPAKAAVIDFPPRRALRSQGRERRWPDYDHYLRNAQPDQDGGGPDRSDADFSWCKKAARRGWSVEETAQKLLEVSEKAQERARGRDKGYARATAQNAADAAQRGRQHGRGVDSALRYV